MKNLKFKSIQNGLLGLVIMFLFVTSCKKEEAIEPIQETSQEELALQLEADPDFLSLKALNTDLLNEVAVVLKEKGLNGEDVRLMYQNRDGDKLEEIFGDDRIVNVMSEVTSVNERLISSYSELIPEGAAEDFELRALDGFQNLGNTTTIESRGCSWRYWVCAGGAWSGLVACTVGTSGWGIFFCNAAYYAALALCTDSYC